MKVNVSAIVKKDGKVFLMQRALHDEHFAGHWGIPGGGMDDGEDIYQTAIREVKEEMGIVVKPTGYIADNRYSDTLFITVAADYISGDVEVDENEVNDWMLADASELPENFTPFTRERILSVL